MLALMLLELVTVRFKVEGLAFVVLLHADKNGRKVIKWNVGEYL